MIENLAVGTVLARAREAGPCTTFVGLVARCGLAESLAGDGVFTVFAPDDGAFAGLPPRVLDSLIASPGQLLEVVAYHLAPGRISTTEAVGRRRVMTLQGEDLYITAHDRVHVDGAWVTAGDLEAGNGLVHIVDRVLLPARI